MAKAVALLALCYITLYISCITSVHSIINNIWQLNISEYCNVAASWNCSSTTSVFELINDTLNCNSDDCISIQQNAFVEISDINTINQYDLYLNYTLRITGIDASDYVNVSIITDTETITQTYNAILPITTYNIPLNASTYNQSSITIKFEIVSNLTSDRVYIMDAILYNHFTYTPTMLPTFEPTFNPTLEPIMDADDKVSFGTEYKDRYMLILAGSMFTGAVLIIIYFRCCKKRMDQRKMRQKALESQSQMEMQQTLNKNDAGITDELVNKEDTNGKETNGKETTGKNEEKNSKKDKTKTDNGKRKSVTIKNEKLVNDKYDVKIGSASPTSVMSVDIGSDNDD